MPRQIPSPLPLQLPPSAETSCEHSDICGRDALSGHGGKCILHSEKPDKDKAEFKEALEDHREKHGPNFQYVVFPLEADFENDSLEGAYFGLATFKKEVRFDNATFKSGAYFRYATFENKASFAGAEFRGVANFSGSTFTWANFSSATFKKTANFSEVTFGQRGGFNGCTFHDRAKLSGRRDKLIFGEPNGVDFARVGQKPDAEIQFRYADLSRCRFLGTRLRPIEFVGVEWNRKVSNGELFTRVGLFDEFEVTNPGKLKRMSMAGKGGPPWPEIEALYRQLKENYEERGDYPRAGDFHIGEKEARRQNPDTHWSMRLLLNAYRALSKYGERSLPAALWLLGLVLVCGVAYLSMGASTGSVFLSSFGSIQDWGQALVLSGEATLFPVRSAGFQSIGPRALNLIQRGLSPILIALLVLALRQRVKR